jgi:hypothetical protein
MKQNMVAEKVTLHGAMLGACQFISYCILVLVDTVVSSDRHHQHLMLCTPLYPADRSTNQQTD